MPDSSARQREFNRITFDNHDTASEHRRLVTELVREAAQGHDSPRICVLGAGNLNDLDISRLVEQRLVEQGSHLTLVDLDGEALRAGVARQGFEGHPAVALLPGGNLSPLLERLSTGATSLADEEWLSLASAAPAADLGRDYDVVLSSCLLSQLVLGLQENLAATDPRFLEVLVALRRAHIRLMSELCRPGGRVLLVTDVVSSDTVPGLAERQREELPGLLALLVAQRNFFNGLNPLALIALLTGDPELTPRLGDVRVIPPWVWRLGPRAYLVCAFTARRL